MELKNFLNSINYDKKALLDKNEKDERLYPPYVVNRCLSFFPDTIFHVNEINCKPWLDKKMQFDFYRLSIRKKKRFSPWIKKESENDIDIIKKVYNYNDSKAKEIINILSPTDLDLLKKSLFKGGTNNNE
jgi:hypothetical protein